MTGLEIFLSIVVVGAVASIIVLALRNKELERGHQRLMSMLIQPIQAQPLPQAAQVVGLIKQENFDRATAWRDQKIADLERRLGAKESELVLQRGAIAAAAERHQRELNAQHAENKRIAGLYQSAESDRQRLSLAYNRLREETATSTEAFMPIPSRIGTN